MLWHCTTIVRKHLLQLKVSDESCAAHHWGSDVKAFRPERFIDTDDYKWPREAFLGFSMGARSCLGQKFAQAEAVAVLTTVIRKYEVFLREDLDGTAPVGESLEAKRDRVTKCKTVRFRSTEADRNRLSSRSGDNADTVALASSLQRAEEGIR